MPDSSLVKTISGLNKQVPKVSCQQNSGSSVGATFELQNFSMLDASQTMIQSGDIFQLRETPQSFNYHGIQETEYAVGDLTAAGW